MGLDVAIQLLLAAISGISKRSDINKPEIGNLIDTGLALWKEGEDAMAEIEELTREIEEATNARRLTSEQFDKWRQRREDAFDRAAAVDLGEDNDTPDPNPGANTGQGDGNNTP